MKTLPLCCRSAKGLGARRSRCDRNRRHQRRSWEQRRPARERPQRQSEFLGRYAEVGFFLTGETRAYKGGSFGRVKVLKPFNDGGWGAFQVNGRIDYLNLSDRVDKSSSSVSAPFHVNGGKQTAYQASLVWNPTDYVRFMAQYSHIDVTGGPRPTLSIAANPNALPLPTPFQLGMFPIGSTSDPINQRDYSSDVFTARAQIDF